MNEKCLGIDRRCFRSRQQLKFTLDEKRSHTLRSHGVFDLEMRGVRGSPARTRHEEARLARPASGACAGRPVEQERMMTQGLVLSRCGGVVSTAIDVEWLARQFKHLPLVKVVDDFYDPADLGALLEGVEKAGVDSLVLAGESPYAFRETRNGEQLFLYLGERGVDRNRVEVVNLLNMVVRAHQGGERERLQEKARRLIDVGLAKVQTAHRLGTVEISPRRAVALVGASPGTIFVAHHLLGRGFRVYLLHRGTDVDVALHQHAAIRPTLSAVMRHPRLRVLLEAKPLDFSGYPGDYTLRVSAQGVEREILVGAAVLSTETQAGALREMQSVFHVDVADQGLLAARDERTARAQTQDAGVFVVNPPPAQRDDISAVSVAADAAAAMVMSLLDQDEIVHPVAVSEVHADLCGGCGVCVKTCMFHAVTVQGSPRISQIDPRRCRGCGNCVTACPAAARDLAVCPSSYLSEAIRILAEFAPPPASPRVLLLSCDGCGYRNMDKAAEAGAVWPIGVMPLWVVCGGQIDTQLILQAFVHGFDGIGLVVCGEGCCHNQIGNVDLERRINLLREVLASRGIDGERLAVVPTCSRVSDDCVKRVVEFHDSLKGRSLVGSEATHFVGRPA
jgi:coenzyme F420-reducing hydrogenase delta subunit/NAD-dependent dihydropyrimidine dehydrogenase PreA subunit